MAEKKLTKAQLEQLLQTPYDSLKQAFPDYPRRYLHALQKKMRKNHPIAATGTYNYQKLRAIEKSNRVKIEKLEQLLEHKHILAKARTGGVIKLGAPSARSHEATAVAIASDWHVEEVVTLEKTNGLNEYAPAIAKARAKKFFENLAFLIKKESRDVKIKRVLLALLGDFISGSIHEDLADSNAMRPKDALVFATGLLKDGMQYLLKIFPDKEFVIICKSGNHGRMTQKQRIKTEDGYSLEAIMYTFLAAEFKDEPRMRFDISTGLHTYVNVAGFVIRFSHGHAISYGGGLGGVTIPVNKAVNGWNKARHADLDCIGHFHQKFDGEVFIVNGSLIGYNEFAQWIKASPEPPQQVFFLVDHDRRRKTGVFPIFVD